MSGTNSNFAQSIERLPGSLFAHKDYVEKYGLLLGDENAISHRFVDWLTPQQRISSPVWMIKNVPDELGGGYKVSEMRSYQDAVLNGAGIGFMFLWAGQVNPDIVLLPPSKPDWDTKVWLVTPVDL